MHVVLGVVAAAGVGGAVWLLMGRGVLLARATGAEAERARSDAERARVETESRAEIAKWETAARAAGDEAQVLKERLSGLSAEMEAGEKAHAEALRSAEELNRAKEQALAEKGAALEKRITELNAEMKATFESLAGQALKSSNESFLQLAAEKFGKERQVGAMDLEQRKVAIEQLLKPIAETLKSADTKLGEIEKQRLETFAMLSEQVRGVALTNTELRSETSKLVNALKKPDVRGRWGEVQLRRVVEVAGMKDYCGDFTVQTSTRTDDGKMLRPDMVIRMPNDRIIVIDAKTNIGAYVEALEATGEAAREERLTRFAEHVEEQVGKLAAKSYWDQFDRAPDLVVMFVPGDPFVDAALARKPDLIERAAEKRVILASPSTLIALLRALEHGWREFRLAEVHNELREEGAKLHDRFRVALEHLDRVGDSLTKSVKSYNDFVGSYERNLEPTMRKFEEAGLKSPKPLPEIKQIENWPTNRALFEARGEDKANASQG